MASSTEQLADFIARIDTTTVPQAVQALARQHILEILAGIFAGTDIPEAQSVLRVSGDGPAELAGKVAMLSHAAESDPIHAGTTVCAGMVAIPPAILFSRDGATALASVVAGYETAIRVGEALGPARLLGQGWWPTAVLGGAGAAAATARALGMSAGETRNALSLALVQTGGLGTGGPEAPESRNLLAAHCVRTGITSATAAAKGLTGPAEPLVGDRGFLTAFGFEPAPERLLQGLGEDWKIAETSVKAFPCALQAQSALTALQKLIGARTPPTDKIQRLEFGLPDAMRRIVDRPGPPESRFAAAASLQFLAAAFLLDGRISPARMNTHARTQDDITGLMDRISISHAADLDPLYPTVWPARATLHTADGDRTADIHLPGGHPDRPLPMEASIDRFRAYSGHRLNKATQDTVIDAVMQLATLKDMTPITAPIRTLL